VRSSFPVPRAPIEEKAKSLFESLSRQARENTEDVFYVAINNLVNHIAPDGTDAPATYRIALQKLSFEAISKRKRSFTDSADIKTIKAMAAGNFTDVEKLWRTTRVTTPRVQLQAMSQLFSKPKQPRKKLANVMRGLLLE